jgi:hypothetical protein
MMNALRRAQATYPPRRLFYFSRNLFLKALRADTPDRLIDQEPRFASFQDWMHASGVFCRFGDVKSVQRIQQGQDLRVRAGIIDRLRRAAGLD